MRANVYEQPHRCTYGRLMEVETMFKWGWMLPQTYNRWMAANGGSYQLGVNPELLKLWDERLPFKKSLSLHFDTELQNVAGTIFKIKRCTKHKLSAHVKINVPKNRSLPRDELKPLNKMFPFSSPADKAKTNLDLASLVTQALKLKMGEQVNAALSILPIGTNNSIACAMVMHAMGNEFAPKMFSLVLSDKACCMRVDDFKGYFKAISTAIRRTSRWPDGSKATLKEVTQCAYWEMCTGRALNTSDWAKECINRTTDRLDLAPPEWEGHSDEVSNAAFLAELKPHVVDIINELVPLGRYPESWPEAVRLRQNWIAAGSAGSAKVQVDGVTERIKKHSYFENIADEEMDAWLDEEPRIDSVASEKFEQSKARAIYGTAPLDYAIMAYVIKGIEPQLHRVQGVEAGLSGVDEVRAILRRSIIAKTPGIEATMVDYADFNLQHTIEAQQLLFEVLAVRYKAVSAHPDYIRASEWCAKALGNQWVRFPNETVPMRSMQGMFSGVRGTNFINTLLNVAYFRHAKQKVADLLGMHPIDLTNIHMGDDVWITNQSRLWAQSTYTVLKAVGYEFQDSKQMFDTNRGEFLRVVYTEEGARGYLARALGTLITRPLQGTDELTPQERANALNSQIQILARRGMMRPATQAIWAAVVPHALRLALPEGGGCDIPMFVAKKRYLDGGLDLGPPGTMAAKTIPTAPPPVPIAETEALEQAIGRNMSKALVRVISERYKDKFDSQAIEDMIHAANVADSLRPSDRLLTLRRHARDLKIWKSKLQSSEVVRDAKLMNDWLQVPQFDFYMQRKLEQLKRQWAFKRTAPELSGIELIMAAIAQSPFKDVATAQKALKLGIVAAAKMCIALCRDATNAGRAMTAITNLESRTSAQITARVLTGVRGCGSTFECYLNPVILSWVSQIGVDLAIDQAVWNQIKTDNEWDNLLLDIQTRVTRAAIVDGLLVELSHY